MTFQFHWRKFLMAFTIFMTLAMPALANCGTSKGSCKIQGGTYHVSLPANYDANKAMPTVVALHSWGATASGLLQTGKMVKKLLAKGYVVIAPEGLPSLDSEGNTWDFTHRARRDNPTFIVAVADDAAKRFKLDRSKMLLVGFSIGGTMVHYTACKYPKGFLGFAPQSGNFWKPYPGSCASGSHILHSHGRRDTTMPFKGRTLSPTLQQGSLETAMTIWSNANGCMPQPLTITGKGITRQQWSDCRAGSLAVDYYPGGHAVPLEWAERVIAWFETL
jgi:polyhydroxybutyrate depolymerase